MSAELLIAKADLDDATLLSKSGSRNAADLCEQAAEKVIRAVLTSEGKRGGIQHRLDEMVDLVPDENPLKPALRELEQLAGYATAYRYPASSGRIPNAPPGSEVEALLEKVGAALREAASRFGVDLGTKGLPAATPAPIR